MANTLRRNIAVALIGAVALTSIELIPANAAGAKRSAAIDVTTAGETLDFSARKRYRRHRGSAQAMQMFGAFAGIVGTIIAAEEARRWRKRHYYYGHPYGPPRYYYGPPPGYYYYYR